VGLILDLAVAALALVVIGSLALLAWTLGVSAVRTADRDRERVVAARRALRQVEERLTSGASSAADALAQVAERTGRARTRTERRGVTPDA
jgi:hypothetical protein